MGSFETEYKKKTNQAKTAQKKSVGKDNSNSVQKKVETFQFVDNRPEAIAQRKLNNQIKNRPQSRPVTQLQNQHDGFDSQPIQKQENNTGMPDNLKSGIENMSGYSMDDVKVHYNSDKPAQLNAHAYAQGTDIHLASGQEKHLPHEAWHVVQQKQGRVKPTMQMKGMVNINDDDGLEKEADEMGAKAINLGDFSSETIAQRKQSGDIIQAQMISGPAITSTQETIQLYGWKDILAGVGLLGGTGAIVAGLLSSSPLWTTGLVVGGAVSVYKGGSHLKSEYDKKKARDADVQGLKDLQSDLRSKKNKSSRDTLLLKNLNEVLANLSVKDRITIEGGNKREEAATGRKEKGVSGKYRVHVMDEVDDPIRRQTNLMHEFTHVSADMRYTANQSDTANQNFMNMHYEEEGWEEKVRARNKVVDDAAIDLFDPVLKKDTDIPKEIKPHLKKQIQYMGAKPINEVDSVLNELLLMLHKYKVPESSPFSKLIEKWAKAAYEERNK